MVKSVHTQENFWHSTLTKDFLRNPTKNFQGVVCVCRVFRVSFACVGCFRKEHIWHFTLTKDFLTPYIHKRHRIQKTVWRPKHNCATFRLPAHETILSETLHAPVCIARDTLDKKELVTTYTHRCDFLTTYTHKRLSDTLHIEQTSYTRDRLSDTLHTPVRLSDILHTQ